MNSKNKIIYIAFVSVVFLAIISYLKIRGYEFNIIVVLNTLFFSLYAGLALFAGWDIFTFPFEKGLHIALKIPYVILKFYLAFYIGLFIFPFWFFKKFKPEIS